MNQNGSCCWRCSQYVLSVLRIVAAVLIMQHGGQKLLGYPSPDKHMLVSPFSWPAGISGDLELVLGFFLLLGLFTRIAAFILSGEMAVAYFMVHFPQAWWPIHNNGELAVIYCFVFLYLCVAGGGPLSADHFFWGRRAIQPEPPPPPAK